MEKRGFHQIRSTGDQALEVLQYLFSNDLDVPVGHIVHTGMLNDSGGYENDCSIARLSKRSENMMHLSSTQTWAHPHVDEKFWVLATKSTVGR
ncbi:pyruvate dehydrogenase phosphatase regulatory subunit, mitochondrial-like [Dasypus novemcinctus]|uniref:pyruvate dehydrogenase phosphatase regulatory subunit, mitochondrial-like n=1 Tax=Dasypus novemcinctus TaxID=9361 RepID=UPI0039C9F2DB